MMPRFKAATRSFHFVFILAPPVDKSGTCIAASCEKDLDFASARVLNWVERWWGYKIRMK